MSQIAIFAKQAKRFAKLNSPQLLTGMAVAGVVSTVILAVRATPRAMEEIEAAQQEEDELLTPVQICKVAWRFYVPAALSGGVTIACIISANTVNTRRQKALASVYAATEVALMEYKDKVVETLGEKADETIRDHIAQDHVTKNPPIDSQIISTGNGTDLFRDEYSGRYFYSDMEAIRKAENDINYELIREDYVSLNTLYDFLGLEPTTVGDDLGWNNDNRFEIRVNPGISRSGKPCLCLEYKVNPSEGFSKLGRR